MKRRCRNLIILAEISSLTIFLLKKIIIQDTGWDLDGIVGLIKNVAIQSNKNQMTDQLVVEALFDEWSTYLFILLSI